MSLPNLTLHPSQGGSEASPGGAEGREGKDRKPSWLKVPLPGGEGG